MSDENTCANCGAYLPHRDMACICTTRDMTPPDRPAPTTPFPKYVGSDEAFAKWWNNESTAQSAPDLDALLARLGVHSSDYARDAYDAITTLRAQLAETAQQALANEGQAREALARVAALEAALWPKLSEKARQTLDDFIEATGAMASEDEDLATCEAVKFLLDYHDKAHTALKGAAT